MDSLSQIVLGAAVGEVVLGRQIGNRAMDDVAHYADIDLMGRNGPHVRVFTNRKGEPY